MKQKKKIKRTSAQKNFEELKKGGVKTNTPEGGRLNIPSILIMQFFGKELQKRFIENGINTPRPKNPEAEKPENNNKD